MMHAVMLAMTVVGPNWACRPNMRQKVTGFFIRKLTQLYGIFIFKYCFY
jgi:hypothetical protein